MLMDLGSVTVLGTAPLAVRVSTEADDAGACCKELGFHALHAS